MIRQILAFFAAPLPAVLVLVIFGTRGSIVDRALALWFAALLVQLVFGVIIRIELRRRRKTGLRWYALGGAIMFGLPTFAMVLLVPSARGASIGAVVLSVAMVAVLGAVTGMMYTLIAGRQRQENIDAIDDLAQRFS